MNAPWGMTSTFAGSTPRLLDQPGAAVLGVDDDRVDALVEPPLGVVLAGSGLARQHVVRGQHQRDAAREQPVVERAAR